MQEFGEALLKVVRVELGLGELFLPSNTDEVALLKDIWVEFVELKAGKD